MARLGWDTAPEGPGRQGQIPKVDAQLRVARRCVIVGETDELGKWSAAGGTIGVPVNVADSESSDRSAAPNTTASDG
jgi:hypothetical protein